MEHRRRNGDLEEPGFAQALVRVWAGALYGRVE
jgi:hypothetical protein